MKKIYGLAGAATFIWILLLSCTAFGADGNATVAEAVFDNKSQPQNMKITDSMKYVEKGGRTGKISNRTAGDTEMYLLVDVNDDVLYNIPDMTPIDIDVTYFDEGYGSFSLLYDSHDPHYIITALNNKIWQDGGCVYLENTCQWKTYTFHLEDMSFTNRGNGGCDFRIGTWGPFAGFSSDEVVFGSIKVKRSDFASLLKSSYDENKNPGRVFSESEAVDFNVDYTNKTDKNVSCEFDISVCDKNENVIWKTSLSKDFEPHQTQSISIAPGALSAYGLYNAVITQNAFYSDTADDKKTATEKVGFSCVDKVDAKNSNPYYGVCQQIVSLDRGDSEKSSKMMTNAGISYVRDSCDWDRVETSKGSLKIPEDDKKKFVNIHDQGLEIMLICGYYNWLYDNGDTPHSDEAIQAYADYCGFMAKELKGIAKYFEIWNEYNIAAFNKSEESPENYAKMLKAAYTAIKKANPDAVVIGIGTASIALDHTKRVFDAGGYDYLDAVSVHPYDWTGSFRSQKLIEDTENLKKLMRNYGEEKPVWYSEMGFATSNGQYSDTGQAEKTVLLYGLQRAYNLCDVLIQYCFHDLKNKNDIEQCWGMTEFWDKDVNSYIAKESYASVAAMNNFIGKNSSVKDKIGDNGCYAVNFYNDDMKKNVLLIGSDKDVSYKSFYLGCRSVDVYDIYGNKEYSLAAEDMVYGFMISETPKYIVGNFSDFKAADDQVLNICNETASASPKDNIVFNFESKSNEDLIIEAEENDFLETVQNNGFRDGKAQLILKWKKVEEGTHDIKINVYTKEKKLVYSGVHKAVCSPMITADISAKNMENNYWYAVADIKNRSEKYEVSGTIYAKLTGYGDDLEFERQFDKIGPEVTFTALFPLPPRIVKTTATFQIKVVLSDGSEYEYTSPLSFSSAKYLKNKPVIDGNISPGEWSGNWIGANSEKDIRLMKDWGGINDLSFSGMVGWDEENFYLMAIVTDDVFSVNYRPQNISNMWKGDGIQFGIDDRAEVNPVSAANFTEIGIGKLPGGGDKVYRYTSYYDLPAGTEIKNAKAVIKRNNNYTVYECSIPWSELFYESYVPDTSKTYRFSALVNDNDGNGRKGWIEYNSGIGQSKDVLQFGTLRLVR